MTIQTIFLKIGPHANLFLILLHKINISFSNIIHGNRVAINEHKLHVFFLCYIISNLKIKFLPLIEHNKFLMHNYNSKMSKSN